MQDIELIWSWDFPRWKVADIWRFASRLRSHVERLGLPASEVNVISYDDGTRLYHGKFIVGKKEIHWTSPGVSWVYQDFIHQRFSLSGHLLKEIDIILKVSQSDTGASLSATIHYETDSPARARKLMEKFQHKADSLIEMYHQESLGEITQWPDKSENFTTDVQMNIQTLKQSRYSHHLGTRLVSYLSTATDAEVAYIQPLKLADQWGESERDVVELFMQSSNLNITELNWNLLCPQCHRPAVSSKSLDQIPSGAVCRPCNKHFGRDFSRNIEVSFKAHPSVRMLSEDVYLPLTPKIIPNVLIYKTIYPGQAFHVDQQWGEGQYRVRVEGYKNFEEFTWHQNAFPTLCVEREGFISVKQGSKKNSCEIANFTSLPQTVVVEKAGWAEDVLAGSKAATMQVFRDLYPQEMLSPGDEVAVSQVAILFTDLKASTELYEKAGDTRAFHVVRDHFDFLCDEIRMHNGAMVKTIGDAVMAAFSDPVDAVRCAINIQQGVTDFNRNYKKRQITLKVGVHSGACLAVTLNNRLDYFGSMINLASRLQGESFGDDVVLSLDTVANVDVSEYLTGFRLDEERAYVKGFEEPVPFVRIRSRQMEEEVEKEEDDEYYYYSSHSA